MITLKAVLFSNLKHKLNRVISTALKKAFVAQKSIQKMAKEDFIMLNLVVSTFGTYEEYQMKKNCKTVCTCRHD